MVASCQEWKMYHYCWELANRMIISAPTHVMFRPCVLWKSRPHKITKGHKAPCPKQAQLLHEHYINWVTLISSSSSGVSYNNTFILNINIKWSNQEKWRGRNMVWEDDDTRPRCENRMPTKIPRLGMYGRKLATCQVAYSIKRLAK